MNKLEYIPGTSVDSIKLDGPVSFVGIASKLRSREWKYNLGYRDLVSANRPARAVSLDFQTDYENADAFRRAADADVAAKTPGTFIAQGEWKQRGYVVASDPSYIHYGRLGTALKVLLLDGAWWRLQSQSFIASETPGSVYPYLDYPYDYQYDYSGNVAASTVETSVYTPSDIHLVIYGPATNPYVIVGSNNYQVNVTVPAGGYLTIDGREKTIVLTLADGTDQNAFQYGVRGTGQGGGSYIFEPIQAGVQDVQWLGTFGFDLGWYEDEGEPPWNQS